MIAEKKINPILYWPGSKTRVAKKIISLFPEHERYIEPFCGSASVLLQKKPVKVEILNDIDDEIFNLFKVILFDYDRFLAKVKWFNNNEKMYYYFKNLQTTDPLLNALKFYYLTKYGIMPARQFQLSKKTTNRLTNFDNLERFRTRMLKVQIINRDFKRVIVETDSDVSLFYLDPPYYKLGDSIYKHYFKHEDHEELSHLLKNLQGKFVLSYNDCEEVRSLYSWAKVSNLKVLYTVGRKQAHHVNELLIRNY